MNDKPTVETITVSGRSDVTYTHTIIVKPGDKVIIKCPGMDKMAEQGKHLLFETRDETLKLIFPPIGP